MESFEIRWRISTSKDLRNLPKQEAARVIAAVEKLAH
jgi:hypothetical protein